MDFSVCSQCGGEIEGKGIHFRGRAFCSDECCEEFEAELADDDEPVDLDLEDEDFDDDIDDDLGYRDGDDDDDLLDDEFELRPWGA